MRSQDLLHLSPPVASLPTQLVDARGGFLWWYLDLLDAQHNAVVLIWSLGLPFLPGYLGAARRGTPVRPASRPSLNLAAYRRGTPVYYQLQEYAEDDASWEGNTFVLGRSKIRLCRSVDRTAIECELDCPVPGSNERLTGTIRAEGVTRQCSSGPAAETSPESRHAHDWTPALGPAQGSARLAVDGAPFFSLYGRAYHDRNGSATPFDQLGVQHWIWGHAPFRDREVIFYLLWPNETQTDSRSPRRKPILLGLEVDRNGTTRRFNLDVELGAQRRGMYGMAYWPEFQLTKGGRHWLTVALKKKVDDGPFYLRFAGTATGADAAQSPACVELVRPDRVDRPLLRPFINMRVHYTAARNSIWLPLFAGRLTPLASNVGHRNGLLRRLRQRVST